MIKNDYAGILHLHCNKFVLIEEIVLKYWSSELREKTRNALDRLDPAVFMHKNRAHLKHIELSGDEGFGWLSIQDALNNNLLIRSESGKIYSYKTIDELVESGWALD